MTNLTMYDVKRARDVEDHLYDIINLAKAGAATSETTMNIQNSNAAMCCLFEIVHRLASEAVDMMDDYALKTPK